MKFEEYYQNLLTNMEFFQNLINNNYFKSFHSQRMILVSNTMKDLVQGIQNYLMKFRDNLFKDTLPENNLKSLDKNETFEDFNKTMDEIVIQLDEVENVKYEKLQEIKEKNENILLIQKHIYHL